MLVYSHKVATTTIGVIFMNVNWGNAIKVGNAAKILLKTELNFQEVYIFIKMRNSQIVEKLDLLSMTAESFHHNKKINELLCVSVVTIGFGINPATCNPNPR